MNKIRQYILFFCSICIILPLSAENIEIEAYADTNKMYIGEQQNIHLSIEYKANKTLVLPQFSKELSHNILFTEGFSFDTTKAQNKDFRKITTDMSVTCFDAGEYSFEIGPFLYGNDTIWSSPILLSVQAVELDTTGIIKDIKPIQIPEYSFKDYISKILIVLGIIAVILLLILGFWFLWKRKKNIILPQKHESKEKADIKAIRELENLKAQNLFETEEYKSYYTELTNILRSYLGDVLDIETFEKTSDEIIQEVVSTGKMPLSVIQNLQIILTEADFVKFAKHKPTAETGNLHYGLSLFCINESKHLINNNENIDNQ
ncbi:MAG: hypothetical protein MJ198_05705 [Bacteroidales bacterium]|nr:hypothetical protein [Bacteroidales bacterium]